jgi:transporter family protein
MNWLLPAILTAIFYGTYNVFIKLSSGHIHQIAGALILQIVAALLGTGVLVFLKIKQVPLEISSRGVWYAVLAGVFVGLAEIFSFVVFSKGVNASTGISIIIGGSVVVGAAIGFLFLKESMPPLQFIGLLLIVAGIVMVSR